MLMKVSPNRVAVPERVLKTIPTATDRLELPESNCPRDWGLYPHEIDCRNFYNCANGYSYLMTCPAGLHFNPYDLVCDWPDNAKCAKSKFFSCYLGKVAGLWIGKRMGWIMVQQILLPSPY